MTLRVTLEIVPFGEEANKYPLSRLLIHNVGNLDDPDYCKYRVEHEVDGRIVRRDVVPRHKRSDGALHLVWLAIAALGVSVG